MKKLVDLVKIVENNGVYKFFRMTAQQGEILKQINDFYMKSTATSGIKMDFTTDARAIEFTGRFSEGSSRKYAFFDIYVNGVLTAHPGTGDYPQNPDFSIRLPLDGKTNRVTIYFPCLARTVLKSFELIGASSVDAVKKNRKLLCYGDSITQGFDCLRPSSHYVYRLAEALDAEEFNKGIGGERHVPALVACEEPFTPDYILAAYGTNDWAHETPQLLEEKCSGFYKTLAEKYTDIPVITITPIWRSNIFSFAEHVKFESFQQVEDCILRVTAQYPNITVIKGFDLVPHDKSYFADWGLHPNDAGFYHYGENLLAALQKCGFLRKA